MCALLEKFVCFWWTFVLGSVLVDVLNQGISVPNHHSHRARTGHLAGARRRSRHHAATAAVRLAPLRAVPSEAWAMGGRWESARGKLFLAW